MTYEDEVAADAPLARWPLDDVAAPLVDATGNGRHLGNANGSYTLNEPSIVPATDGTSLLAAGANFSNEAPWLTNAPAVTVEAWVMFNASGGTKVILSKDFVWWLGIDGTTAVFNAHDGGSWSNVQFPGLTVGTLYHIVGVHTGTQIRIYVNGVAGGTANTSIKTGHSSPLVFASGIGGAFGFSGHIDEAAVYPSALSAARVSAHYDAGLASVSAYKLSGSAASDARLTHVTGATILRGSGAGNGNVTGGVVRRSVSTNRAHGRQRNAVGTWSWEPPVVAVPESLTRGEARVVAAAFGPVTMRGAQPVFDVSGADTVRGRYRFIIGGKDVTFFRDVPIPDPSIELAEPLLWAVGSIELPQIAAAFERLGVGELRWLREFSTVTIQRVHPDTDEVLATDFRGIIVAFDTSGATLRLELGGEAHGRAALMNKQPPIFQRTRDLGVRAWQAIDDLGLKMTPRLGPATGKMCERIGGTSYLDHIREITSRSWGRFGRQRTIMPADPTGTIAELRGVYRFDKKDDTTVHGTVFADDARVTVSLRRDLAEEPNRIYVTGVTPAGMRVRFGSYPGLQHGKAAPYPFEDGRTFGTGTTNAETDTGDGISLLTGRLHMLGYLDQVELLGGYDFDISTAVTDLQRDADLPKTGNVDPATWAALYDLDVTGYSLGWAQIQPAAQRSKVRKWRLSGTGAVMGKNPNYRRNAVRVDRNIDMGTGFTRQEMRDWAVAELHDSDDPNWVGTITFAAGMGYLAGDVPIGAEVDAADVRDARGLRPGMNLVLPMFDGGTFVHVAGVNISPDGSVVAAVDTRFRDAAEVWSIISRNREARRRPGRYLSTPQRSSTIVKDSIAVWDEIGGILDRAETLGPEWTVFPVVAGQEGTISRLRMEVEPAREFVVAVFGKRIHPRRLTALVGNPLTKKGSKRWVSESVRDRLERDHGLLYVAGDDEQPCGYWPKVKAARNDEDNADAPLTGRWEDDAGFPYRCPEQPVLWVAVWAGGETKLPAGRIMWPQLEAGV